MTLKLKLLKLISFEQNEDKALKVSPNKTLKNQRKNLMESSKEVNYSRFSKGIKQLSYSRELRKEYLSCENR